MPYVQVFYKDCWSFFLCDYNGTWHIYAPSNFRHLLRNPIKHRSTLIVKD